MQTYRIYVFDCIFGFKSLKTYDFVVKLSWWSYTFDCFWINVWSFSFSWFFHRFDCCFCGFLWFFFVLFLNHFSPKISSIFLWFLSFFFAFHQLPRLPTTALSGDAGDPGLRRGDGQTGQRGGQGAAPRVRAVGTVGTIKNGDFHCEKWWFFLRYMLIYHKNMGFNLTCKHWGCDGI